MLVLSCSVFCLNRKNFPLILCSVVISNPNSEALHPAQGGSGGRDYRDRNDKDDDSLTDSESELDLNEDIISIVSSLADRVT